MFRGLLFTASLLVVGACAKTGELSTANAPQADTTVATTTLPEGVGINLAYMDTTVSPGEDFFQFVNGRWLEETEIPGDQGRWGSFQELRERNNQTLLQVLEEAASNTKYVAESDERKAAEFYRVGMDSLRAEQLGTQPIAPIRDRIKALSTKKALQDYLAFEDRHGGDAFYGFGVYPDLKNSKVMAAYLGAGGLGLPDRDYYLNEDAKSKEVRERYQQHIARILEMMGETNAQKKAQTILAIETRLAKNTLSKEERRNPYNLFNKKSIKDLNKLAPSVNWTKYLL